MVCEALERSVELAVTDKAVRIAVVLISLEVQLFKFHHDVTAVVHIRNVTRFTCYLFGVIVRVKVTIHCPVVFEHTRTSNSANERLPRTVVEFPRCVIHFCGREVEVIAPITSIEMWRHIGKWVRVVVVNLVGIAEMLQLVRRVRNVV